ncbi:MAG: pantoate--beta-alanine ligase [Rikenellaceae bacterium]
MEVVKTVADLQKLIGSFRSKGSVGLVPTMGALHKGHISLVNKCKSENGCTVVSIFVNPTQFNDKNDLKNYPRTQEADCELLKAAGCDIVFAPSVEEVYPEPDTRVFDFGSLEKVMEGASRKGHFNGVAQIVSKLFMFVEPDKAYFGEKDFQQLAIIRKMTLMLNIPVDIVGVPIVRQSDGLALSSRNMLLTKEQKETAPLIYKTLTKYAPKRDLPVMEAIDRVVREIEANEMMEVEYFVIADSTTLTPIKEWSDSASPRGFIVVKIGGIRLIDNVKFQ